MKKRRICARKPRRDVDVMWKAGETCAGGEKTKHESIGSVAANQDNIENRKKAGSKAQGTKGLRKKCKCRGSVSSLSRLIQSFRRRYH